MKIWDTPWLPSQNHPRILSPVIEGMQEATVDSLIDQQTRTWDMDVLKGFFAPLEVGLILKIPLSSNHVEDKLVWPHTANGVYSVKSEYNFLAKEKTSPSLVVSLQDDGRSIWKKLWSLSVPNKIKNFLWRASREAIPVKKNLVARKVLSEEVCDHCHVATEDVHHALWECHELSALWESNALWLFRRTKKFLNFFELVSHVLEEKINSKLFATLVWMIWSYCNTLRTSTKPFPLSQVALSASQTLQTFAQALLVPRMQSGALPKQHIRWNPPPSTSLKINFDGAVFRETDEAGLGVVVCDHQGKVMASMFEKIKLPSSSNEVEALAAMRAISFALELHLPSIIVEGDSELIISTPCSATTSPYSCN